jgi:hypothetical protein
VREADARENMRGLFFCLSFFQSAAHTTRTRLLQVDNLAVGLLQLLQHGHEVPEAALGHHRVRGEDGHLQQRGLGVLLRGHLAADDFVLVQLGGEKKRTVSKR